MRFAIWAAVSTKQQKNNVSLSEQETKCRAAGEGRGWIESAGPYIVPGATRSFYVNLSDAERDIPQLRQMLEDARNDRFDVIAIFSYDRLGDLVDMIAQSLSFYGKQIFSVSQPVEPQPPENFDRYAAEAEAIMRDAARITQRFRINDLRRKHKAGMPIRAKRGLLTSRTPFGYIWKGKKEPPVLDRRKRDLLVRMKDMFLAGEAVAAIIRMANESGIKPAESDRWQDSSIRMILQNPFYAGYISIHRYKTVRDPRNGHKPRNIMLPKAKWTFDPGQHEAVWDRKTYEAIVDEMERRHQMHVHQKVKFPFSGMLYCSECKQKLHRVDWSHGQYRRKMMTCATGKSHVRFPYDHITILVARHIANEWANYQPGKPADPSVILAQVEGLRSRRTVIQEGWEVGLYDKAEAVEKMNEIEVEIEKLQLAATRAEAAARKRQQFFADFQKMGMDGFEEWLLTEDARYINQLIRSIYDRIFVSPDGQVQTEWAE